MPPMAHTVLPLPGAAQPVSAASLRRGPLRLRGLPGSNSSLRRMPGAGPCRLTPLCASGKGFSKKARKQQASRKKKKEESEVMPGTEPAPVKRPKFKGKKAGRMPQPVPQGPPSMVMPDFLEQQETAKAEAAQRDKEADFEKRLAVVALEGKQRKEEKAETQAGIFDGDIYSRPPPLSQTLMGKPAAEAPADDLSSGTFGPGQVAITSVTIFAIVAFLASSFSSDLVLSTGGGGVRKSSSKVARERSKADTEKQQAAAARFESALAENPDDLEALEGAAVSYAELGDYTKAVAKLKKLAAAKPEDVDVLRLLAEAQSSGGDAKAASESYRRAITAAGADRLELLQGLCDTLSADKKQSKAVDEVLAARSRVAAGTTAADFTAVEADLLLARVYAAWPGHTNDALKVYDSLIAEFPDDFRGYLAKGVLLRSNGQKGDAERMFIQAKYLAPKEARAVVNRVAAE
mmetsp:Transcript_17032/g.43203  ORF Transcript_17032/g.43203 Transcript_17032/m.43203 type:complete len:462 (-) Transcript_17032:186-1571(-)